MKWLTTVTLLMLLGCSTRQANSPDQVFDALSQQQKFTLLSMLEAYPEQKEALRSWQQSEESVKRLVALETDLQQLIIQLDSMATAPSSQTTEQQAEITEAGANTGETIGEPEATIEQPDINDEVNLDQAFTIQLAALKDMPGLGALWTELKQEHTFLLAEKPAYYQVATDASGTEFYRLKVGRFSDKNAAMQFCRELKQQGVSCIIKALTSSEQAL